MTPTKNSEYHYMKHTAETYKLLIKIMLHIFITKDGNSHERRVLEFIRAMKNRVMNTIF